MAQKDIMSKLLVDLLRVHDREFRDMISRLERVCLSPGVDIRLSGEIQMKTRSKSKELQLDADDTTLEEFYYGLRGKLIEHDTKLLEALKLTKSNPQIRAKKLTQLANRLSKKERSLSITPAGCRRMLLAVPPRRTLKMLKLRSLESVLKREDPRVLYALAAEIEDDSWRSQIHAKMKRLQTKDIGWHVPEAVSLSLAWYEKLSDSVAHHGLFLRSPEMGVLVVMPVMNNTRKGLSVYALGTLLQALSRFSVESMPYVQTGLLQGYNVALPEIAHTMQPTLTPIHGLKPSWSAVYELFLKGHLPHELPDTEFLLGDMSWQTTEMKIAGLMPDFSFWVGTHFLGKCDEHQVISMHFLDVARNVVLDIPFGQQQNIHLEASLWNELQVRYLQQETLSRSLVNQLRREEVDVL